MKIIEMFTHRTHVSSFRKPFERIYMACRKNENRVYTDDQVMQLPFMVAGHIHYEEWQTRRRSASRLIEYLKNKNRPLEILEAGCGNGWLSGRMAQIHDAAVTGADINREELEQASRVFGKRPNILFILGDLDGIEIDKKFDMIIFAASIQYFPSFERIIRQALSMLNQAGEIHILDSPFYRAAVLEQARQRSRLYYQSTGHPEMAEYYFHHGYDVLGEFNYRMLYDPLNLTNRLLRRKDPFPWICITAE